MNTKKSSQMSLTNLFFNFTDKLNLKNPNKL